MMFCVCYFIQMASLVLVCFFRVENQPVKNKDVCTKLREKREQLIRLPVRRGWLFTDMYVSRAGDGGDADFKSTRWCVCQNDSCELWQHTSSVLDLTFNKSVACHRADDGQSSAAPWTFDLD